MDQLYNDGMTMVGFPNLFITFTCNPNWQEIQRVLDPLNLKPQDRPNIIVRIFKMKFNNFFADVIEKGVLEKIIACKYNISTLLSMISSILTCRILFPTTLHSDHMYSNKNKSHDQICYFYLFVIFQIDTQLSFKSEVCHLHILLFYYIHLINILFIKT